MVRVSAVVECPTCGSPFDEDHDVGEGWTTPTAEGAPSEDGQRYTISWWARNEDKLRKNALFRVTTDDRVSVLLHVRAVRVSQRVSQRRHDLDDDATLDDIPHEWLQLMRADGYTPATEVNA